MAQAKAIFRSSGSDKNTPAILADTDELQSKGSVLFLPLIPPAVSQNAADAGSSSKFQLLTLNAITGAVCTEAQHTTAPTITIDQYSRATGQYTRIVNGATMTKISGGGGWEYAYDFVGTTWLRGDLARVIMAGGVVTISSKTYTFNGCRSQTVVGLSELMQKIESDIGLAHGSVFTSLVSQGNIASYVTINAGAVADTYGTDAWVELLDGSVLPTDDWAIASITCRSPSINKTYQVEIGWGNGADSGTDVIARFTFTTGATVATPHWPIDFARIIKTGASLTKNIYCRARSDSGGGSFGIHVEVGGY